ncbi:MAG: carboxypeptidase-like regulatory domain-containing protein [Planctomycetota bacterium]
MGKVLNFERAISQSVLLLLVLVLAGCGESTPTGTVKGEVTLDGEPYSNAAVVLMSMETGQGGSVDIQPDGTFALQDPIPVGTYTVYLAPKAADNETEEAAPVKIDTAVPDKYWSEMSDIQIEVNEGKNDVTVPLES